MKSELWDRARVDALKATAYISGNREFVVLAAHAGPADGAQAARELLPGAAFSHLTYGMPLYRGKKRTET